MLPPTGPFALVCHGGADVTSSAIGPPRVIRRAVLQIDADRAHASSVTLLDQSLCDCVNRECSRSLRDVCDIYPAGRGIMTQLLSPATRPGTMREILDLLSITDDRLTTDPAQFWQKVALAVGVEPQTDLIGDARVVLDSLGDWDDDYLSEDGFDLSDEAYRDVLAEINERTNFGSQPWPAIERQPELISDEDDEYNADWANVQFGIGQHNQPDVRTILTMVYERELSINPEWQRNFVWSLKKQRRFIESILMGLPIPSILLSETAKRAEKFVIDGRQRLETLARFCATPEQREALPLIGKRFKTFSAKEPLWREGEDLHGAAYKYYEQLPDVFRRKIDRATLTVFTFKGLQPRQLYQIFQRYNTGGEKLKAAEIRNAVYQASELHKMLWRMAGESPDRTPFLDQDEQDMAETLRNVMRNKTARYGAYDFLGRVMAFTYLENGKTVAAATNDFMDGYEDRDKEQVRRDLLRAFGKVIDWYRYPLSTPSQDGRFHNFLGTIQLVTAHRALKAFDGGSLTEPQVESAISSGWLSFAQETLEMKQNAGTFWQRQRDWWHRLEAPAVGA